MLGYHAVRNRSDVPSILEWGLEKRGNYFRRGPSVHFYTDIDETDNIVYHHAMHDGAIIEFEVPDEVIEIHPDEEANSDWHMQTAHYMHHHVAPQQIKAIYYYEVDFDSDERMQIVGVHLS